MSPSPAAAPWRPVDSLTLQNGSSTYFDIASAISFDSITSAGNKVMNGALYVNLTALLATGSSLSFFQGAGTLSGQFASIHSTGVYGDQNFTWNTGTQQFSLTAQNQILSFGADGVLNVSAIPEPSSVLLLTGGLMAVVLLRRRSK